MGKPKNQVGMSGSFFFIDLIYEKIKKQIYIDEKSADPILKWDWRLLLIKIFKMWSQKLLIF